MTQGLMLISKKQFLMFSAYKELAVKKMKEYDEIVWEMVNQISQGKELDFEIDAWTIIDDLASRKIYTAEEILLKTGVTVVQEEE